MEKMISYAKLSKKEKRKLDNQKRVMWSMNPVTRKSENPKAYNRRKALREFDNHGSAFVLPVSCLHDAQCDKLIINHHIK